VRDIKEKLFSHPFAPLLKPLSVTRWAKSPRAAGKHQESLLATVRTADAGKPAARIAAVEVAVHDLLDDRPEEAILPLESALIFGKEPVEVMEQHPVERSPLGMSRTVDSGHSREFFIKKQTRLAKVISFCMHA